MFQLPYYIVTWRKVRWIRSADGHKGIEWIFGTSLPLNLSKDSTLSGAGEDCFRGLFLEVSLALVGVASPA